MANHLFAAGAGGLRRSRILAIACSTTRSGFSRDPILPLLPEHKLAMLHPSDGFTIILDTAMTFGFVLASPVILYQVWAFLAPGPQAA